MKKAVLFGILLISACGTQVQPDRSSVPGILTTPSDQRPNVFVGAASWYGPGLHGKKTASGEIFDESKFTAAHPSIPLGRTVRVTHLANGKSVDVVINDRGPYIPGRIIDLSQAAAKALGIVENGIAKVRIELLHIDSRPSSSSR